MTWRWAIAGLLLPPLALAEARAQDVAIPVPRTARAVLDDVAPDDSLRVPVTRWRAGEVHTIFAEGHVRRRVWQIGSPGMTTQQILAPIQAALEQSGYHILLECEARDCGGFAFRFETDTLPPPEMYVDLGDYRFLAAQHDGLEGTAWVTLMASRSDTTGFLQVTEVLPGAAPDARPIAVAPPLTGGTDVVRALLVEGRAVLSDLSFLPGSADLGLGPFAALSDLARYLNANPEIRILLVGHTDAEGALPGNIQLSRLRAASVRARLVERYGIAPDRVRAEGVGYLAPIAPNSTAEGRDVNRRVEVILDGSP
ncbi:MAG: OmpA family protein [Pseudomonadota bacterium]